MTSLSPRLPRASMLPCLHITHAPPLHYTHARAHTFGWMRRGDVEDHLRQIAPLLYPTGAQVWEQPNGQMMLCRSGEPLLPLFGARVRQVRGS
jgi:hypothetical protein